MYAAQGQRITASESVSGSPGRHSRCSRSLIEPGRGGVMMQARVDVLILSMVLVALVLPAKGSAQVETQGIEFPYVLRIAPGNVLIVHGRVYRDSVTITWEPGDSLRIEGMAVLPAPAIPPKVISEERRAEIFGDVPLIVAMVDSGTSWKDALNEYRRRCLEIRSAMLDTYWAVLDSTGSQEAAADAVLNTVDRSLFADGAALRINESCIRAPWQDGATEHIPLERPHRPDPQPERLLGPREKAVRYTESIARRIDHRAKGHWVVVVDRRGWAGMSGAQAREALKQIEMVEGNKFLAGPLDEFTLEEIVLHKTRD